MKKPKKPTKREIARNKWVEETQMFQRIAKQPETPREDLEKEWDDFQKKP